VGRGKEIFMRKLTWNCDGDGCYYQKACPKLGMFDDCMPGKIGMSDVDGIVEINGKFLLIEWKYAEGHITVGQRIMFERMTALSPYITVLVVAGDPQTMEVYSYMKIHNGKMHPIERIDLEGFRRKVRAWANLAYVGRFNEQ
jgi:hypothetical protein